MAGIASDLAKKNPEGGGGVSSDDFRRDNIAGSHGIKIAAGLSFDRCIT